ncbi:hypothetical protein D9M72_412080 [compost metagenome]
MSQRVAKDGGVEGVDPGIDFPDLTFLVRCVLVLADARDGAVRRTQDSAITGGVVQDCCQDGDCVAFVFVDQHQFGKQFRREQRNVSVGNHNCAAQRTFGVEGLQCRLHRAAGAGHFVLVHYQGCRIEPGHVGCHEVAFVPDDNCQLPGIDGAGGTQGMADQRQAADFMEDLGGTRLHPGTGTCS